MSKQEKTEFTKFFVSTKTMKKCWVELISFGLLVNSYRLSKEKKEEQNGRLLNTVSTLPRFIYLFLFLFLIPSQRLFFLISFYLFSVAHIKHAKTFSEKNIQLSTKKVEIRDCDHWV